MGVLGRSPLGMLSGALVIVLGNAQNVNLSTLSWGAGVWASSRPKMVIVPTGVTIGSLLPGTPAMDTGTGWGGTLTIIVNGNIEGAGGAGGTSSAPAGGVGGTALLARANGGNKPIVVNSGLIAGGGGGGGRGGQGGAGAYSVRVDQGPYYSFSQYRYQYSTAWSGLTKIIWAGVVLYDAWDGGHTSRTLGEVTYYLVAHQGGENYSIARYYYTTVASTGGQGGNGGRGRGYAQSLVAGSSGSPGGTNAGTGGTGGSGADRGSSGASGNTGFSGNAGSGLAGSAGGLAGWGIENPSNVTLSGSGTLITRT